MADTTRMGYDLGMAISVLYVYIVRYDVATSKGECFGGRARVTCRGFTEIPKTLAMMRRVEVEAIQVESAVLIERKEIHATETGSGPGNRR